MISVLKKYKRPLIIIFLEGFFWLNGIVISSANLDFAGPLFLLSAFGLIIYVIFIWLLGRVKIVTFSAYWYYNEIWAAFFLTSFLYLFGIVEAIREENDFGIVLFFLLVMVSVLMVFYFRNYKKKYADILASNTQLISMVSFWLFAIGGFLLLIVLEETSSEPFFSLFGFIYFSLLFYWGVRWTVKQVKSVVNLKKEKSKTELMHLKSQVNPHFFFNMLNNLYGWVDRDAKTAKNLILQLSEMMRYSIYEGQKELVTLEDEIVYLEQYIALHKMRYHKEIKVELNKQVLKEGLNVMPLLFIILVENAFKHGVEKLRQSQNPYIIINLISSEEEIFFEIINNYDHRDAEQNPGIGLANLKRRLELGYPKKHALVFYEEDNEFKVHLTIKPL